MSDQPKLKNPFNKNPKKHDAADSSTSHNAATIPPNGGEQIKPTQQSVPTISTLYIAPVKNIEPTVKNTKSENSPQPIVVDQSNAPSKTAELASKLGGLLLNAGKQTPTVVSTGLNFNTGSSNATGAHVPVDKTVSSSDVNRSTAIASDPIIESSSDTSNKYADKTNPATVAIPAIAPPQLIRGANAIESTAPQTDYSNAVKPALEVALSSAPAQLIRRASEVEETSPHDDRKSKHAVFANGYQEQHVSNGLTQINLPSKASAFTTDPSKTKSVDKIAASPLPQESFDDTDEDILKYLEQRQTLISRREEFTDILIKSFIESSSFNVVACRDIHASVSNHQLNGLNTRYPGYIFARDEEGNTLFHNSNVGSVLNFLVFEELARLLDISEFGRKILPEIDFKADTDVVVSILKLVNAQFINGQNELREGSRIMTTTRQPSLSVQRDTISAQFTSESIVMTGWLYKRHGHNDFKKRFCILTDDMLSYYENENIGDSTWKGSLKVAGCGFKVLAVDYGNAVFKSQTSFVIQAIERKKREKSWSIGSIFGGGKQAKGNDSNLDKIEMEFVAQTEIEAQRWIYTLRALTGHIVPVTSITSQKCINIEARAVMLNITNNNCETPLHKLARVCNINVTSDEGKFAVLACVQWLFANECDPFKKNKSGRTASVAAKLNNNLELSQWIQHFTDCLLPGTDSSRTCEYPVLPPPVRVPGYSYLSFVLYDHKHVNSSEKGSFFDLKNVQMMISVLNGRGEAVDASQQIERPLLHHAKQLFWGHTFHVYIPLETVPEDAYVVLKFSGRLKATSSTIDNSTDGLLMTKHIYRINTSNIYSGFQDIKFTESAVTQVAGSGKTVPAAFDPISKSVLTLSVVVTRISL